MLTLILKLILELILVYLVQNRCLKKLLILIRGGNIKTEHISLNMNIIINI
jgi:hypothetical protein